MTGRTSTETVAALTARLKTTTAARLISITSPTTGPTTAPTCTKSTSSPSQSRSWTSPTRSGSRLQSSSTAKYSGTPKSPWTSTSSSSRFPTETWKSPLWREALQPTATPRPLCSLSTTLSRRAFCSTLPSTTSNRCTAKTSIFPSTLENLWTSESSRYPRRRWRWSSCPTTTTTPTSTPLRYTRIKDSWIPSSPSWSSLPWPCLSSLWYSEASASRSRWLSYCKSPSFH